MLFGLIIKIGLIFVQLADSTHVRLVGHCFWEDPSSGSLTVLVPRTRSLMPCLGSTRLTVLKSFQNLLYLPPVSWPWLTGCLKKWSLKPSTPNLTQGLVHTIVFMCPPQLTPQSSSEATPLSSRVTQVSTHAHLYQTKILAAYYEP